MAKKGEGIFLVYVDIDAKHDQEFNGWYNTEPLPELLAVPFILSAARYKAVKVGPKYLAFYEISSPRSPRMRQAMKHAPGSLGVYARIDLRRWVVKNDGPPSWRADLSHWRGLPLLPHVVPT